MSGYGELGVIAATLDQAAYDILPKTVALLGEQGARLAEVAKGLCSKATGRLSRSIWGTVDPVRLAVEVGPYAYYGHFVEYGTYKMAPAPFMGPALVQVEPDYVAAMESLGGDVL